MTKEFSITFEFQRDDDGDVNFVNEVLSHIPLTEIKLDGNGYLCTTERHDQNHNLTDTTYRYGFDSLKLMCTMDKMEGLYHYQIDTIAYPVSEIKSFENFKAMWDEEHPDRVVRLAQMFEFKEKNVYSFVLLHHEKIGN